MYKRRQLCKLWTRRAERGKERRRGSASIVRRKGM
jgi:hypothetical protein